MLVICLASLGLTLYYTVELVICFTGTLDTPRRPRHSYLCHIQQTDKSSIPISSSGKGPYNTYWGSIASVKDKRALAPALETLHIYHDCVGGLTGGFLLQRMGGGTQHVPVLRTASTWHSDVGITCFSGLAPSPGFSQSHPLPPSASDSRVHIYLSHPLELRELRAQMSYTHAHLVTPAVLLRTDLGKGVQALATSQQHWTLSQPPLTSLSATGTQWAGSCQYLCCGSAYHLSLTPCPGLLAQEAPLVWPTPLGHMSPYLCGHIPSTNMWLRHSPRPEAEIAQVYGAHSLAGRSGWLAPPFPFLMGGTDGLLLILGVTHFPPTCSSVLSCVGVGPTQ